MSEEEVGQVWKFATIFLLGYLIPTSTGNEFFSLNGPTSTSRSVDAGIHRKGSEGVKDNSFQAFFEMELEERLENCIQFYAAGTFGEIGRVTFRPRENAFRLFLQNGLVPFLSMRPAHPKQVELLHVLAMSIAPCTSVEIIPNTTKVLEGKGSVAWKRAKRFFDLPLALSLELNYAHRLALVKLVAENLVISEFDPAEEWPRGDYALVEGAVPHLRAALRSFARSAMNPSDAYLASRALVSIVVQQKEEIACMEEWDLLMKPAVESHSECSCSSHFCATKARGDLLRHFILRYNEARHYADEKFTLKTISALKAPIGTYADWLVSEQKRTPMSPCLMESLLMSGRDLFYFYLYSGKDQDKDEMVVDKASEEDKEYLIKTSAQLLQDQDVRVARAASALLVVACAYCPVERIVVYASLVRQSIEFLFKNDDWTVLDSLEAIIASLSRLSQPFASSLMTRLLSALDSVTRLADKRIICHLTGIVAVSQPVVARWKQKNLSSFLEKAKDDENCFSELSRAVLACRQAYLFASAADTSDFVSGDQACATVGDLWVRYKLAGHALVTGNFGFAADIYKSLSVSTTSEESFLWLSVLLLVAESHSSCLQSPLGQASSSTALGAALCRLELMSASGNRFAFQKAFLRLRVDFLDLCVALRHISREIRLTNSMPKKNTRSALHLRKVIKCFGSLAASYHSAYKRHGLFVCQQSRTVIRTYHFICSWIGNAAQKILLDKASLTSNKMDESLDNQGPHGDCLLPSIMLLRKLDDLVLNKLEPSLEPAIRSATLIEILDAIFRAPPPIPFDLTLTVNCPPPHIEVSPRRDELADGDLEDGDTLVVFPGMPIRVDVSGSLPSDTVRLAKIPFHRVIVWSEVTFKRPLHIDDAGGEGDQKEIEYAEPATTFTPIQSSHDGLLLSGGRFFFCIELPGIIGEGVYSLSMKLGCRDVRGSEWELARDGLVGVDVRVSRSR
jgi:hypothetical protein